jgi:ABC-type transport system involved in cytochrome c biogenesis ATPase subunit
VRALCSEHLAAGGMVVLTSHQDVDIAAAAAQTIQLEG